MAMTAWIVGYVFSIAFFCGFFADEKVGDGWTLLAAAVWPLTVVAVIGVTFGSIAGRGK